MLVASMTSILLLVAWGLGHTEINEKALKKSVDLLIAEITVGGPIPSDAL